MHQTHAPMHLTHDSAGRPSGRRASGMGQGHGADVPCHHAPVRAEHRYARWRWQCTYVGRSLAGARSAGEATLRTVTYIRSG